MPNPSRRGRAAGVAISAAALLGACAAYVPDAMRPGDSADLARQRLGAPTAEHRLADGGQRLEYAHGPFGRHTYMLDFDAQGRLLRWEDVLTESHFSRIRPGMTTAALRQALGTPSEEWGVRYHDQTVWSYRFKGPFCQLFHVGITPQGIVEDTSFGADPRCERDTLFGR